MPRETHKIRNRGGTEFSHNPSAMNFDCFLSSVQLGRNLFIQKTHNDETQDFKLTRGQFPDTCTRFPSLPAFAQLFLTASQGTFDRSDQFLVVKRLRQKINGAFFHRPSGGRHVAMASNENNLFASATLLERFLQRRTLQSRHADIE